MTTEYVRIEKAGDGVAYIILNNPGKKNALNADLLRQLCDAVDAVQEDAEVRCVILKGDAGCFCSGGDLLDVIQGTNPMTQTVEGKRDFVALFGRPVSKITRCEKPFIAQVEGYAMGGGFSLALGCDMIYAAESARFASNFLHVGVAPEMGVMLTLSLAVGTYKAKEIWFSGRKVSAPEGDRLGFVSKLIADDQIEAVTLADARVIAGLPSSATRIMKRVINTHVYSDLEAVIFADAQDSTVCLMSEEARAYMAANFLKKK